MVNLDNKWIDLMFVLMDYLIKTNICSTLIQSINKVSLRLGRAQ